MLIVLSVHAEVNDTLRRKHCQHLCLFCVLLFVI